MFEVQPDRCANANVERCRAPVTAEFALLLGAAFGQPPRFWLAQQAEYDLWVAAEELGNPLAGIRVLDRDGFRDLQ